MTSRTGTARARRRPSERSRPAGDPDERRGPSRRRYLARRWIALLIVLSVLGLTYVIVFTSLFGVRTVEVLGVEDIKPDAVREAAAIEPDTPMVQLDTDEVARRVAELPRVFEVSVSRSFPSTVEIHVTERSPVAVRPDTDGVHLVDRTGADYATVQARPPGLPVLKVVAVAPDDPSTHAAVTVLGALPDPLREKVVEISAGTPGDVRLRLAGGKTVKWGDAEDNTRKAAVLAPLLTRSGKTYDVATPEFPTVS
ncbi:MAG: FtsQ-type POTRA domain-containing protein [Actinophytocola sp.]|uniref:cell division protein FtsQ/DivIB n=1 Tax=Actinophytocola sp. TaxID=1872138 RepID=UPI00132233E4|nr:FtsQ-type POTRA domain-containing protein [Actinophytocola sp.]MPZ85759.1 FtsQ-type POTRA domain-containing protein [Actinophytocola sp.]